jgi:hypothetical protein
MDTPLTVQELVRVAVESWNLRESQQKEFGDSFSFDAVLIGDDPQTIIIIEEIVKADQKSVKEKTRKIESFMWFLYSQKKHNLVTLILLFEEQPTEGTISELRRSVTGLSRLFIVSRRMSLAEVKGELYPLGAPKWISSRDNQGAVRVLEQLAVVLGDVDSGDVFKHMVSQSRSSEELKNNISDAFQQLLNEATDALR